MSRSRIWMVMTAMIGLIACTAPGPDGVGPDGIFDPYETANRARFENLRKVDTYVLRPVGVTYAKVLPGDLQTSVGNFADNFGQPSNAVNAALQGNAKGFGLATSRFVINTLLGFGGLFDPATDFGLDPYDTDFGETLHVWGAAEGAFLIIPLIGPTTERDFAGRLVDLVTNPLSYAIGSPESRIGTVANVADTVGARGRLVQTVDSLLYDSADPYAQSRLVYLQNRRFELGQDTPSAAIDPFDLDTEGF